MNRVCVKCNQDGYLHVHHVIPKSMGGDDEGEMILLCQDCHRTLHNMLPAQIFEFVSDKRQVDCLLKIQSFTHWFIQPGVSNGWTKPKTSTNGNKTL